MKKIITTLVLLISLCGNAQEFKSNYNKGKYVVPLPDRREWMIQADGSEFKYFKLNSKEYKESTEELLAILENYKANVLKPNKDKGADNGITTLFDYDSVVKHTLNGDYSIDLLWVTKSKDKVMFKTNGRESFIIIVPKNY